MEQHLKESLDEWKRKLEKAKQELENLNTQAQEKISFLNAKIKIAQNAYKNISISKQKEFADKFITSVYEELDEHESKAREQQLKNATEIRELEVLITAVNNYMEHHS